MKHEAVKIEKKKQEEGDKVGRKGKEERRKGREREQAETWKKRMKEIVAQG